MSKKMLIVGLAFMVSLVGMTQLGHTRRISMTRPQQPTQKSSLEWHFEAAAEETVYFVDFEDGIPPDWETVDVAAQSHWHASTLQPYGGSGQSYYWGLELPDGSHGYESMREDWLETPEITVPGGTSSLTLTFDHRVDTEGSNWDGSAVFVSYDGGAFELAYPIAGYNADPLQAFEAHGYPAYAGWSGLDAWRAETFNLDYDVGTVKIRYIALSDWAWDSFDDPSLEGIWVDNIRIEANGSEIFFDDADDPQMISTGPAYNDPWTTTGDNAEIGTANPENDPWWDPDFLPGALSANCDDANSINAALISPIFALLETGFYSVSFYAYCEMPDYDGDNDGSLDDYWHCEISTKATNYQVWEEIFYSSGSGMKGLLWEIWNVNRVPDLNLSTYAGQSIRMRFRVTTDGNDDGGDGRGLFIDNFALLCTGTCLPCQITLTSPTGGESMMGGEQHDITWSSQGTSGNVEIEYSTNGGSSWQTVVATTPDDGSYLWTVPNTPSANCLVKICDADDDSCCDQSDNAFTIYLPCEITLTSPDGGESWCSGENHDITWTSQGTSGNVEIEYSTNSGSNWQTVVANTPDEGSYPWTTPKTPSVDYLVKVCDAEDTECCDQSDDAFKISECGPLEIVTESLPEATEKCRYDETLIASGGILPYSWSILSGALPTGLNLNSATGTISGKPDSVGTFCFTAQVEDDMGATNTRELCLSVIEYAGMKGDPNGDCAINILDVLMTVNIVLETIVPTPDQEWAADCNGPMGNCDGDGTVNIVDALKIVNLILGLDECP